MRAELDGLVEVVGDAATSTRRSRSSSAAAPDVVLLDVHMPDGGGVEVIRRAADAGARHALPRPVGLRRPRGRDRDHPRRRARLRDQDDLRPTSWPTRSPACRRRRRLLAAARRLRARRVRRHAPPRRAAATDAELDQLTAREREVLRHIARGYLYKEIALRLGISTKTVEAHVSAVLRKLQLSNRHELSRWAAQRRLD